MHTRVVRVCACEYGRVFVLGRPTALGCRRVVHEGSTLSYEPSSTTTPWGCWNPSTPVSFQWTLRVSGTTTGVTLDPRTVGESTGESKGLPLYPEPLPVSEAPPVCSHRPPQLEGRDGNTGLDPWRGERSGRGLQVEWGKEGTTDGPSFSWVPGRHHRRSETNRTLRVSRTETPSFPQGGQCRQGVPVRDWVHPSSREG